MKAITTEQNDFKEVHRNLPQLKTFLINADFMVCLIARAVGKTHGITATWIYERVKKMPRSHGAILSPSYAHLIDTIIPAMQQGWAELNLLEGTHYWIREKPPIELRIPQPYLPVDDPKYFIFFVNGSVLKLVSQDRKALVNSKSFDYIAVEEGRKVDGQRFDDDVVPTIRGGKQHFGHLPEHHSVLICSDKPKDVEGRWILRYKKKVDVWRVETIMKFQKYKAELVAELEKAKNGTKPKLIQKIEEIEDSIDEMRRDLVCVIEGSTLDNIHALGVKPLKQMRRSLGVKDYDTSVLNLDTDEVENNFYGLLSKEKHGYEAINYKYIDSQVRLPERNCLWDADVNTLQALDIVLDKNLAINCLGVSQRQGKIRRLLNFFYVLAPLTHVDVVDKMCKYYQPHKLKKVRLIYNHTFTAGKRYGMPTAIDEIRAKFESNGYEVGLMPLGQALTHEKVYDEFAKLFRGEQDWVFKFNLNNCEVWYEACKDTKHKMVRNLKGEQFKKDKSSEDPNSGIPPWEATHPTECIDQLLHYDYKNRGTTLPIGATIG